MQHAEENFQVEGNQQCLEFIDKWRSLVVQGKINFIGIIACETATQFYCDHIGVIGTEFASNFAADYLKKQIQDNVFRRLPMPSSPTAPADQVVYNLASGPCSFDFLAWIQIQEMRRLKENLPGPLKVAFSMGSNQNFAQCMVTDQRRVMYEGVMRPLITMVGAEEVMPGTPEDPEKTAKFSAFLQNARWPETYTLNEAVALHNIGAPMPKLTPSAEAVAEVERFLKGQKPPVVITLREATHWPHRNSNLNEWLKFADYLSGKGENVLFLRDTAKAREPLGAYHTVPPCSIELNSRLALYQRAKANIFCANGPATLCHFTEAPWFMVAPLDPSLAYPPGRPEWWLPHHGIPAYGQFPWSGPNQRIVWELDTVDVLIDTWEKFENGDFNHAVPPNQQVMPAPLDRVPRPMPPIASLNAAIELAEMERKKRKPAKRKPKSTKLGRKLLKAAREGIAIAKARGRKRGNGRAYA